MVAARDGLRKMTERDVPLLVVVTGPPASGKTTLADALARELGLPLVTKDAIKEALFDTLGARDREWSRALGRAAFAVISVWLEAELRAGRSVIAEANFDARTAGAGFARLPAHRTFQIHCTAPREVLLARYSARVRHPGHLDGAVLPELEVGVAGRGWEPLDLPGERVELDTAAPVDVDTLVTRLRGELG